jgi:UDP-glucose 4-epimerase
MKKNHIIVTGGAGFVGSHLISHFLNLKKFKIISIDNYTSGTTKNHIKHKDVKYLRCETTEIKKKLFNIKNKINAVFHFGEFARIYQSFKKLDKCFNSNSIGSMAVFKFCLENNIKLIYSATSASLGNNGSDKNLSPYAFTKAKNLELLENFKKWFNFKYEIIYFYNVYGPRQIATGDMATVIGIFENQYKQKKPLTVVKPGTQARRFTHINDTIKVCVEAWKKNKNLHYSILSKKSYTIQEVAKLFKSKIKYVPYRQGERYTSAITKINLSNKIVRRYGKIQLNNYIKEFLKNHSFTS